MSSVEILARIQNYRRDAAPLFRCVFLFRDHFGCRPIITVSENKIRIVTRVLPHEYLSDPDCAKAVYCLSLPAGCLSTDCAHAANRYYLGVDI